MTTKAPHKTISRVPTEGDGLHLEHRWRWTVDEFQRAYDLGVFGFDVRLELIEGEIVKKMPQNEPHAMSVQLTQKVLEVAFSFEFHVRNQAPLVFGSRSKPEPDLAVVRGSIREYGKQPTLPVLVVEVSDSTLRMDRAGKAAIYARAGIAEYWIVNLVDRVLEVHRDPGPLSGQPLGHHYRSIMRHGADGIVSPLAASEAEIAVADLLP